MTSMKVVHRMSRISSPGSCGAPIVDVPPARARRDGYVGHQSPLAEGECCLSRFIGSQVCSAHLVSSRHVSDSTERDWSFVGIRDKDREVRMLRSHGETERCTDESCFWSGRVVMAKAKALNLPC